MASCLLRVLPRVGVAITCALLLAGGPARSSALDVGARNTSATAGAASDSDSGSGFDHTESLAKIENGSPNPYTWFASALVSDLSNLEVGVDLTRPACCVTGTSDAIARLEFSYTNPLDIVSLHPRTSIMLPPGEVIFRLPSGFQPVAGQDRGYFEAAIFQEGFANPLFLYRLELVTTDGGFEEDPSSTDNVPLDLILDGAGGEWGYKTLAADIEFDLPAFGPHETKNFRYEMRAHGENFYQSGEVGAGFSVKLGDPFDVTAGGGLEIVAEPSLLVLLGSSFAGLAARRRRPR
jgi:hypothetical protein